MKHNSLCLFLVLHQQFLPGPVERCLFHHVSKRSQDAESSYGQAMETRSERHVELLLPSLVSNVSDRGNDPPVKSILLGSDDLVLERVWC